MPCRGNIKERRKMKAIDMPLNTTVKEISTNREGYIMANQHADGDEIVVVYYYDNHDIKPVNVNDLVKVDNDK